MNSTSEISSSSKRQQKGQKQRVRRASNKTPKVVRKPRPPDCTCHRPTSSDYARMRARLIEGVTPAAEWRELCPACARSFPNPSMPVQAAEKTLTFRDLADRDARVSRAPPRCLEEEVFRALRGKNGLAMCPVGCDSSFKRGDMLLVHLRDEHASVLDRVCAACRSEFDPLNQEKCHICTILRTDPVLAPPQSIVVNAPTLTRFPKRLAPRRFSLAFHSLRTQGGPRALRAKDRRLRDGDLSAVRRARCRSLDLTVSLDAAIFGCCNICLKQFFCSFDPPEMRRPADVWRALAHSMNCSGYGQDLALDDGWVDTWR